MQTSWRIGTLFGIPVFLDSSWFIILILVTLSYANYYTSLSTLSSLGVGFIMAILLFTSVLLHELGHSLVAMYQGIKVNSITLFLFGGIASIEHESKTPGQAFQVAIAGPLVSLFLFFMLGFFAQIFPEKSVIYRGSEQLAYINGVLAFFNLIPGLPLDGGQVLKAAIWKMTGSRFTGVRWAANVGQLLGWLGIAIGLSNFLFGGNSGGLWIALIGWFAIRNAANYNRMTNLQEALVKVTAAETMSRDFRIINGELNLRQFAEQYLLEDNHFSVYVITVRGQDRGLVFIDDIRMIERSLWEVRHLTDILHPLPEMTCMTEKNSLLDVIKLMESQSLLRIIILSPADSVVGVIDRGDVVRAVARFLNITILETEIRRIKEEGKYPPGFELGAIANMTEP